MINRVATIAVALVKKLPADLEETKLSCDAPKPNAPPSDFCKSIMNTNTIAKIMFKDKNYYIEHFAIVKNFISIS